MITAAILMMISLTETIGVATPPPPAPTYPPTANCGALPSATPIFPRVGDVIVHDARVPIIAQVFAASGALSNEGDTIAFQLRDQHGVVQHLRVVSLTSPEAPRTIVSLGSGSLTADGSPYQLELVTDIEFSTCHHHTTDTVTSFTVQ